MGGCAAPSPLHGGSNDCVGGGGPHHLPCRRRRVSAAVFPQTAPSVATGTATGALRYPVASHVGTAARHPDKTTGVCGGGAVWGRMRAERRRGSVQEGCGPYRRSNTSRGRDWAAAATAATAGRSGRKTEGGRRATARLAGSHMHASVSLTRSQSQRSEVRPVCSCRFYVFCSKRKRT